MLKAAIEFILRNPLDFEWSVSGLGKLRLYLDPRREFRLHVWDRRLRGAGVSTIHDHPWDFESTIVAGELVNQRYYLANPARGVNYKFQKILCGVGGGPVGEPSVTRLEAAKLERYRENNIYIQDATEVHQTAALDGTVTLVRRRFREDVDHANVFWLPETEWVDAEPRAATPEEVKAVTAYSLHLWFPPSGRPSPLAIPPLPPEYFDDDSNEAVDRGAWLR